MTHQEFINLLLLDIENINPELSQDRKDQFNSISHDFPKFHLLGRFGKESWLNTSSNKAEYQIRSLIGREFNELEVNAQIRCQKDVNELREILDHAIYCFRK